MISEYFRNPTSTCDYPLLTINTSTVKSCLIVAEARKPSVCLDLKIKCLLLLLLLFFFPHLRTNTCGSLDAAETLSDPFQYCMCNAEDQSLSYNFITSPSTSYFRDDESLMIPEGGETGSTASANSNRTQQLEYGAEGRDRRFVKKKNLAS